MQDAWGAVGVTSYFLGCCRVDNKGVSDMKFHLFIYATLGRRHELEAGMAGKRPELYQRMLDEVAWR